MPAIQAMRSDALALRAKEDVQEKIPSFFNSVNKSLGQNIVQGQDSAQAVAEARFAAANQLAATLRQKLDGEGSLAELVAGAGMDLINSSISLVLAILGKTTTQDLLDTASAISAFLSEREALQLQWDAAAATFAQWTVQAGYTGHGSFFPATTTTPTAAPREQTMTQWLKSTTNPATLPLRGDDGTPNLAGLRFEGESLTQPDGLTRYTYLDTNLAGGVKERDVTVNYDISGDGLYGADDTGVTAPGTVAQRDASSQVFKDAAGFYWIRYDYVTTVQQQATPTTYDVQKVIIQGIQSGVDYDTRYGDNSANAGLNTLEINSDTDDFDRVRVFTKTLSSTGGGNTINVGNTNGFYVGDLIAIPVGPPASPGVAQAYDYKTITSLPGGGVIRLDSNLSGAVTPGGTVNMSSYPNPADYTPASVTTLSADSPAPTTLTTPYAPSVPPAAPVLTLDVASTAGMQVGDLIQVTLDTGEVEQRTINAIGAGNVTLNAPLSKPAGAGQSASTTAITATNASNFAEGDIIAITLASGAIDYRTIITKTGNRLILEQPLSGPAASGANISTVSGTDSNSYPDTPRFYRAPASTISTSGTVGTITIPAIRPVFEKAALGGRGATTYRDALTPRWTDRNYFGARSYDTYYDWGSVGSISRVGRYATIPIP
jgi:hypothetical protein